MVYWLSLDVVEQRAEEEERETAAGGRSNEKGRETAAEERMNGRKGERGRCERKNEEARLVTIDRGVGLFMGVPMRTICSKRLVVLNVYTSVHRPMCTDQLAQRNHRSYLTPLLRFGQVERRSPLSHFSTNASRGSRGRPSRNDD